MKDLSQAAIQFSGYPLSIADLKPKSRQAKLTAIKSMVNHPRTSFQIFPESRITNDPKNWDVNWFNGYE
jgi:hypothetical protein